MKRLLIWCVAAAIISIDVSGRVLADGQVFAEPTVHAEWTSLDVVGLDEQAKTLVRGGEAEKNNRILLADYVAWKFLNEVTAARSVGTHQLGRFVIHFNKDFTDEKRAMWLTAFRAAFVDNQEQLGQLKADEFVDLSWALRSLKDAALPMVTTAWTQRTGDLAACPSKDLFIITRLLAESGDEGEAARTKLAAHLTADYVGDSAKTKAVNTRHWYEFAKVLGKPLDQDTRNAWISRLKVAFMGNLAEVKSGDMQCLGDAIEVLGDKGVPVLINEWVNASNQWESSTPLQTYWVARKLGATGEAGKVARRKMVEHLNANYLANVEATRSIRCDVWALMCRSYLSLELTPQDQAYWVERLHAAFIDGTPGAEGLSAKDFRSLAQGLVWLGDKGIASPIRTWLETRKDQYASLASTDLSSLVQSVAQLKPSMVLPLMEDLESTWDTAHGNGALTMADCKSICWAWYRLENQEKGRKWAMRFYQMALGTEEARAKADLATLDSVAQLMRLVRHNDKGDGNYGFAHVVARLAREGKLPPDRRWGDYCLWGLTLGNAEARAVVQAELTDAEGQPRTAMAYILYWAHLGIGEQELWQDYLAGQIQAAGSSGDLKARWLMARAFAAEPWNAGEYMVPLNYEKGLTEAFGAATSEDCRFAMLCELARAYATLQRHKDAQSLLDSVAAQFAAGEKLAALRQEIANMATASVAKTVEYKQDHKQRVAAQRRAELLRRLAKARREGDETEASRLEAMLATD